MNISIFKRKMAQKNSSKTLKSDVSEFQNGFLLNEYGSARCEN